MTTIQIVVMSYLAIGVVHSYITTRYLRGLVEHPTGGAPRLVVLYLLIAVLWLPFDIFRWLASKLPRYQDQDEEE